MNPASNKHREKSRGSIGSLLATLLNVKGIWAAKSLAIIFYCLLK